MLGLLVGVLLLGLFSGCSHEESVPPPPAPSDSANARALAAARTLDDLVSALRREDRGALSRVATRGSRALLGHVLDNVRALGVRGLRMRYVDALGPDAAARGPGSSDSWVGEVQVGYRLPMDPGRTRLDVAFTFAEHGDLARITGIGGHGHRSPLWLRGAARILRTARTTVVVASGDARRYRALARHAVRDVDRVLTGWHGQLVLEVPRSESELDSLLDADRATYANIAAVTTTVDGSQGRRSPVHVFVNPAVFDTLKRKGAQVVISHESTHVATGATFADMPTWLVEGFADYVALDHAGVPVHVAAAQVLARIRRHGPPRHLPTARELRPTAKGLGATYEEAWLACRFLARQYGEASLVRFYRTADRAGSLGPAFRQLGTTRGAFVKAWSAALTRLAGSRVAG